MSAVRVKKIIEQVWYTDSTYGTSTANFLEGLKFKGTTNFLNCTVKGERMRIFCRRWTLFLCEPAYQAFLASSSSKLGQEQKKGMTGEGEGNFREITRLETLARQAISLFAYFVISIPWMVFHNTSQGEGSTPQFFLSIADKLKWEVEKYTDKINIWNLIQLSRFRCSYLASTEWFLSCIAFSVYEVNFVACHSRSWFVYHTTYRLCDMQRERQPSPG